MVYCSSYIQEFHRFMLLFNVTNLKIHFLFFSNNTAYHDFQVHSKDRKHLKLFTFYYSSLVSFILQHDVTLFPRVTFFHVTRFASRNRRSLANVSTCSWKMTKKKKKKRKEKREKKKKIYRIRKESEKSLKGVNELCNVLYMKKCNG